MSSQPKRRYFLVPEPYTGRMADIVELKKAPLSVPPGYTAHDTTGGKRDLHRHELATEQPQPASEPQVTPMALGEVPVQGRFRWTSGNGQVVRTGFVLERIHENWVTVDHTTDLVMVRLDPKPMDGWAMEGGDTWFSPDTSVEFVEYGATVGGESQ